MPIQRSAPAFRTAPELTHQLRRVIALFPKIAGQVLQVPTERAEPVNVTLVYAFAAHTVEMARGALALYAAELPFAAVPLMRTAMECAMTAAWLSVAPEQTRSFLYAGAVDRRRALDDMAKLRLVDVEEALAEARDLVGDLKSDETEAGRVLKLRMEQLAGATASVRVPSWTARDRSPHAQCAAQRAQRRGTHPTPAGTRVLMQLESRCSRPSRMCRARRDGTHQLR